MTNSAMKPADAKVEKMEVDEVKKEEPVKDINVINFENIKEHIALLDRGEAHLIGRVLQVLHKTRKNLNPEVISKLLALQFPLATTVKNALAGWVPYKAPAATPAAAAPTPMEVDGDKSKSAAPKKKLPESELYVVLLVTIYLMDTEQFAKVKDASELLISLADGFDKRSLDAFTAKGLFYKALAYEKLGTLKSLSSYLNSRLRAATLRHLYESQATLIITLLRCYLLNKEYQAGAKLVSKVTFPEGANNNDLARFLYYQGRIKALQLDYTAAAGYFMQAMRKSPQEAAVGFKQNVQKWVVVIGLLQGEIPERSIFRQPIYRKCLLPYLDLTHSVRLGDLAKFNLVVTEYTSIFEKDETLTLIVRLRQNVIKTAVKQISLAYSRITIKDIAKKLLLTNEVETEYIVAKAIADGAIDAAITGDAKDGERYMRSSETADIYRTVEPQTLFDSRIRYCLELHNQAVKALRYPPKNKLEVETIEAQREREQQELEFAKELAEEDDDDF